MLKNASRRFRPAGSHRVAVPPVSGADWPDQRVAGLPIDKLQHRRVLCLGRNAFRDWGSPVPHCAGGILRRPALPADADTLQGASGDLREQRLSTSLTWTPESATPPGCDAAYRLRHLLPDAFLPRPVRLSVSAGARQYQSG